jgi:hypothetical protein
VLDDGPEAIARYALAACGHGVSAHRAVLDLLEELIEMAGEILDTRWISSL